MTSALQIEILDLRHFSARQLRPLLEAESRQWSERLRWDYRGSADLLLQYLDSRMLPGFVALDHGRVCGYIFCVHEANKAVVGDVFASAELSSQPTAEVEIKLITHLLEMLQNSPNVDRIEAQLLLHEQGQHLRPFLRSGFRVYPRLFMERSLRGDAGRTISGRRAVANGDLNGHARASADAPDAAEAQSDLEASSAGAVRATAALPGDLELRGWSAADFFAAGDLIQQSYLGHLDSRINNQYRSVAGSLRFLHNIVRFPGCGVFDPGASLVLRDRATEKIEGLLLCSRVRQDVGHITQICVARKHRRQGLGRLLVEECSYGLKMRGFSALTLTVTQANLDAIALYERLGFHGTHRFDAMVWDPLEN